MPTWLWIVTLAGFLGVIGFDFWLVARKPRDPSLREAAVWVGAYVALAVAFGCGVLLFGGARPGSEFFAGWITEYSLSVDNLFVFLLIMSRFAVPARYQQKVLLVGIVLALALRSVFIAGGAQLVSRFSWMFFLFGAFLLYTAWKVFRGEDEEQEYSENALLRMVRRVVPATDDYHGAKMAVRVDGRLRITPILVVMVAIGTTDLLFAVDSIPAIFGLTTDPYLVFTANAFALMGLRQLYFLIGGLLDRLVYLNTGLAVVLAFIGVKLLLEALHKTGLESIPQVPIAVSLAVIVGTLAVTAALSLAKSRRDAKRRASERAPRSNHTVN